MGAASGSCTLVVIVLADPLRYNNLEAIETGRGISLRPLSVFANEVYRDTDMSRFSVKLAGREAERYTKKGKLLSTRAYKVITMVPFKLEGQKILRNSDFSMTDRLLLGKIDYESKTMTMDGRTYPMLDTDFPTVNPADPYALTPGEEILIYQLALLPLHSEKLQRHVRSLYSRGSLYKIFNGNLLLYGRIPVAADGSLLSFPVNGGRLSGETFLDHVDLAARRAHYSALGPAERAVDMDFLWFLWADRNSPIFGCDRMITFERCFFVDESIWTEPRNVYYQLYSDSEICEALLREFGLEGPHCYIINGHVPVKSERGESPTKGGGRPLVIDGNFCKAYQQITGIAGYTLTYNSTCYRLVSHELLVGRVEVIYTSQDIASTSVVLERLGSRLRIVGTDVDRQLQEQIGDLMALLLTCHSGTIAENHKGY